MILNINTKPTLKQTNIKMLLDEKQQKIKKINFFQSEVLFHLRVVEKISKVWVKEI